MILTVTLNPLLEFRLTYKKINYGYSNRDAFEEIKAGGKGINVSRQLNCLNTKNLAFTFIGGNKGKMFKEAVLKENLNLVSVRTNNETRSASVIIDQSGKNVTTYFGTNPAISIGEVEEFKTKLEKMIQNCEIVVFSGSSPCKETDNIFPFGINTANKYDKISLCDTYGEHLKACLENSPTIVHNNIAEIEGSLNISLNSEEEKIQFLNYLYKKNVKQSFITDGSNPFYASNFDFHFKIEVPKVNTLDPTGSGDSFAAGIIYGWHNDFSFEESVSLATALGTVNASSFDVCSVTFEEAESFRKDVKIFQIGKKILPKTSLLEK